MDLINEKVMHKVTVADKVSLDRLHKGDLPSEKEAFQRERYGTITHKGGGGIPRERQIGEGFMCV